MMLQASATSPLYLNQGLVTDPIMIDARVFVNTGTFIIGEPPTDQISSYLNPVVAYETSNTLIYTNRGSMSGIPGFNFEFIDDFGRRRPSDTFYNGPGARITGEFANLSIDIDAPPDFVHPTYGGLINIWATNIVNKGTIAGYFAGDIQIKGKNVDIGGGRVGSETIPFSTFETDLFVPNTAQFTQIPIWVEVGATEFYPETDVVDIWWRYSEVGINLNLLGFEVPNDNTDPPTIDTVFVTPFYGFNDVFGGETTSPTDPDGFVRMVLTNPQVFVWTNQPPGLPDAPSTNKQVEVVIVDNFDTNNVFIDVSWRRGPSPDLPALTSFTRFTTFQPDLINQGSGLRANQFVIVDNYGSDTLETLLANIPSVFTVPTAAPTNLFAFRAFPPIYVPGEPIGFITTNETFYPGLFTVWYDEAFPDGMNMTNNVSTNRYATWAGSLRPFPSNTPLPGSSDQFNFIPGNGGRPTTIFDNVLPTPVPGASLTNIAGRVAIDAENLNLRNARLQGQGLVSIRTDNLVSSKGAVIDAPILNLDLNAKDGNLVVQDLAKGSVSRFGGNFFIFSTTFTNGFAVTGTAPGVTNGTPVDTDGDGVPDGCDTNGDGTADENTPCTVDEGEETTTNYVAIYHITVIRNTLTSGGRVFLNDLRVRGVNVDIRDNIVVDRAFACFAPNLTISGSLDLLGQTNLVAAQFPSLVTLTNNGSLLVPGFLAPGIDPAAPLAIVNNTGSASATAINLRSERVENSGTLTAAGGNLQITATDFESNGGSLLSAFDIVLDVENANFAGISAQANGFLTLNIPGRLVDGGLDAPGLIGASYGVNVATKPAESDLRGTTLNLVVPQLSESLSFWAGDDLGPTRAGFTNNLALGVLALDAEFGGVITISQIGDKNAIYVEQLAISDVMLADLENSLILTEGMTLYYATTDGGVDPAILDGFVTAGGGTLRWVKDGNIEGGVVTVEVQLGDGRILRVPKALRYSATLDSDSDGVVNANDVSPFDLVVVSQVNLVDGAFEIQWNAAAGQTYEVQATTNLKSGQWMQVKSIKNNSNVSKRMALRDPVDPMAPLKAYRVVALP